MVVMTGERLFAAVASCTGIKKVNHKEENGYGGSGGLERVSAAVVE